MRHQLQTDCLRVTISRARRGAGYRLSHCRFRAPVSGSEKGAWVPTYGEGLPKGGLTQEALRRLVSRLDRKASRLYQAQAQRLAERQGQRLRARRERHEQERARHASVTVKTEPHPSGGTMNWIQQP